MKVKLDNFMNDSIGYYGVMVRQLHISLIKFLKFLGPKNKGLFSYVDFLVASFHCE